MLNVYVCEDNRAQKEKIVQIIKNYLMMQDYDIKFEWAGESPYDLLDYLETAERENNGLFFLDVDLDAEMNGIMLGGEIKKKFPHARIVFVTTHAELTYLTFLYKVEAMDYIPKDDEQVLKSRITGCIDVAIERYLNSGCDKEEYMIVQNKGVSVKLPIKEILFIESSSIPHRLVIHLDNRQVEYYGKIKEVEYQSEVFYRCHQSFVVNIDNIYSVDKKKREILMTNGEICYVSVRYLKGLSNKIDGE